MGTLSGITLVLGALILAWNLLLVLAPRAVGAWLVGFPRNVWAGRMLAAVAVGWAAYLAWTSQIAWLEQYRLLLCLLAPAAYALIILFAEELLAARAFGGLLLLVPVYVLEAAFTYPSASRLVMTAFAYVLVILGMILVWSPFMFRKMTAPWAGHPHVCRALGAAGSAAGLGLLLLAWFAYR